MLVERKNENFMSLTVERLLVEKREEGYEDKCNNFLSEVANLYEMLGAPGQMDKTNTWRFSMSIVQRLQMRLKEGNKDFKQKLRVFL